MQATPGNRQVIPVTQPNATRTSAPGVLALILVGLAGAVLVGGGAFGLWRAGLLWTASRYLILLVWLIVVLFEGAARFIRYTYSLATDGSAARWLLASLISPGFSQLTLWDTNLTGNPLGETNLIRNVGGPGMLTVSPGLVALVEGLNGQIRVLQRGRYTLGRLERVKEIIQLGTVSEQIDERTATTRDGITVSVTGIRCRYRQYQPESGLDEAVRLRVYNLDLDERGEANWSRAVVGRVSGTITRVISENILDYLTAPSFRDIGPLRMYPSQVDPRALIRQRFEQTTNQLRDIGADLLWYDIGHFSAPSDVLARRAETWQSNWEGNMEIRRAQATNRRTQQFWSAYNEGCSEAQADLLIKIVKGMDEIIVGSSEMNIASNVNAFVASMTQLLHTLANAIDLDKK